MALTQNQKTKLKKILVGYHRELKVIVSKHKKEIVKAVEDLDRQKTEKIKKLIASA